MRSRGSQPFSRVERLRVALACASASLDLDGHDPGEVELLAVCHLVDDDVHSDGKRFPMLKPAAAAGGSSELHVVLNFFDELRRRVPLPE